MPAIRSRYQSYLELTKPRLVSLTLWSTAGGVLLANQGAFPYSIFFWTLLGAALVAAGSMSLNQWMEHTEDAKMSRTSKRPLPAGELPREAALRFGILLSALGSGVLFFLVNPLSALLAFLTLAIYVLIYTPLKKKTSFNTIVGAVPGALPPLVGWAAVDGKLPFSAWALFAIIFFWQMPHFYAISWFCRKDYEAAGFKMLAVEDSQGNKVARHLFLYNLLMLPVSVLPSLTGLTGFWYFYGSIVLGTLLTLASFLCLKDMDRWARVFFRSSLAYLTLLFILMVADKQ